jgi:hypothetical protein
VSEESIEAPYALKQLVIAGVRVFFYLEDRERTLNSPIEKAMLSLQTMADEMEREKGRLRVSDAMQRNARATAADLRHSATTMSRSSTPPAGVHTSNGASTRRTRPSSAGSSCSALRGLATRGSRSC